MKTKWLNNSFAFISHFTLIFNEDEYLCCVKELNMKGFHSFDYALSGGEACVVEYHNKEDAMPVQIVLVNEAKLLKYTVPGIIGILAHEATHIWQHACVARGEHNPSVEFEAYCIGHITEQLCRAFFDRKFPKLLRARRVGR